MKIKKYIPWAIGGVCLLVLAITALILLPRLTAPQEPESAAQFGYAVEGQQMIQTKEAAHGKDYEIAWADPALEQIVRLYLDKPEGPILHSDVWDIHAVYLRNQHRFFTDAESADGYLPDISGVVSKEPLPLPLTTTTPYTVPPTPLRTEGTGMFTVGITQPVKLTRLACGRKQRFLPIMQD